MADDIVGRLRGLEPPLHWDDDGLLADAADEIRALRRVVYEACDVALVYVSDEPAYFSCGDDYGDRVDSARFSPEQAAAVKRALTFGVPD